MSTLEEIALRHIESILSYRPRDIRDAYGHLYHMKQLYKHADEDTKVRIAERGREIKRLYEINKEGTR